MKQIMKIALSNKKLTVITNLEARKALAVALRIKDLRDVGFLADWSKGPNVLRLWPNEFGNVLTTPVRKGEIDFAQGSWRLRNNGLLPMYRHYKKTNGFTQTEVTPSFISGGGYLEMALPDPATVRPPIHGTTPAKPRRKKALPTLEEAAAATIAEVDEILTREDPPRSDLSHLSFSELTRELGRRIRAIGESYILVSTDGVSQFK